MAEIPLLERGSLKRDDANVPLGWRFLNITSIGTYLIKNSAGVLHNLTFNKASDNGVYTLYDGVDATGTVIGTVDHPNSANNPTVFLGYDVAFEEGLTIVVTVASGDLTVSYI